MINEKQAKKFCCEDISLIYGYADAMADKENMWEIHHTLGLAFSVKELKEKGLYFKQPAEYLMFVTRSQHKILHNIDGKLAKKISEANKGNHHSDETKRKISESSKGEKNPMYGRIGEKNPMYGRIGEKNPMYGKHHSDETKRKISESSKGEKNPMYGKTGEKCHNSKPVLQIDKQTGQVIRRWPCTWEVQRQLGIASGSISKCCLGKLKSAGGFIWRYESGGD